MAMLAASGGGDGGGVGGWEPIQKTAKNLCGHVSPSLALFLSCTATKVPNIFFLIYF